MPLELWSTQSTSVMNDTCIWSKRSLFTLVESRSLTSLLQFLAFSPPFYSSSSISPLGLGSTLYILSSITSHSFSIYATALLLSYWHFTLYIPPPILYIIQALCFHSRQCRQLISTPTVPWLPTQRPTGPGRTLHSGVCSATSGHRTVWRHGTGKSLLTPGFLYNHPHTTCQWLAQSRLSEHIRCRLKSVKKRCGIVYLLVPPCKYDSR